MRKIYNKKGFWGGIGWLALGVLGMVTLALTGLDAKIMAFTLLFLLLGISGIARSLSRAQTVEDRVEAHDERRRLIEWRAESRAFGIGLWFCGAAAGVTAVLGVRAEPPAQAVYGGMILAFSVAFLVLLVSLLAAWVYYNRTL